MFPTLMCLGVHNFPFNVYVTHLITISLESSGFINVTQYDKHFATQRTPLAVWHYLQLDIISLNINFNPYTRVWALVTRHALVKRVILLILY